MSTFHFNAYARVTTALAAAALIAAPGVAGAQTVGFATAPVTVTSVALTPSIDRLSFVGPLSRGSELLRTSNDVTLDFVNTGDVKATSVTFVAANAETTRRVIETGTFAPGVRVERTIAGDDAAPADDANWKVAEVRFADGRVWTSAAGIVSRR